MKRVIFLCLALLRPRIIVKQLLQNVFIQFNPKQLTRHIMSIFSKYRESCDATLSILREYECNLRIIKGIDSGWVSASNEGLMKTNGTYTLLLMADDILCIDILDKLLGIISSTSPDIIYGDILWKLNKVFIASSV